MTTWKSRVSPELVDHATAPIHDYAVGLVGVGRQDATEDPAGALAGSGTLVTVAGHAGILTAAHVLRKQLGDADRVGLVLPDRREGRLHCPIVPFDLDLAWLIEAQGPESEGPDVGFFPIPPDSVGMLKARKSFLPLDADGDPDTSPPSRDSMDAVWGLPAELVEHWPAEGGYDAVRAFRSGGMVGEIGDSAVRGDHDYVTFPTNSSGSFKGCSGGGLWEIPLREDDDGELRFDRPRLAGVVFYQSEVTASGRVITCHGRRSVYGALVDRVHGR